MIFSLSLSFSCLISTIIPIYIEYMREISISPLFAFSILYLIAYLLIPQLKYKNKQENCEIEIIKTSSQLI